MPPSTPDFGPITGAPVIFSLEGPVLTAKERAFFGKTNPYGFILMGRNCETPSQVRSLTDSLRETTGRAILPILIDQEGGRVQRLKPPHWPQYKPAAMLSPEETHAQAHAMAQDLKNLGITVNCTPVLDIPTAESHSIIGDRAFAKDVAEIGRIVCDAHLACGVVPVMKHIPGHGRATSDSHTDLPRVNDPLMTLQKTDFAPFRCLNTMPWAMTAHVVYTALDPLHPASTSPTVIRIIREDIGFMGLLLSDDVGMEALAAYGNIPARTKAVLDAGCDLALYCGGDLSLMEDIAFRLSS